MLKSGGQSSREVHLSPRIRRHYQAKTLVYPQEVRQINRLTMKGSFGLARSVITGASTLSTKFFPVGLRLCAVWGRLGYGQHKK